MRHAAVSVLPAGLGQRTLWFISFMAILLAFAVIFSGCATSGGASAGGGANTLTIKNGTGEHALVRLKTSNNVTQAELAMGPGESRTCQLPPGNYYEVVRFGQTPETYRYSKGQGFSLTAPPGQYIRGTLTLHQVMDGNYATTSASANDF